MKYVGNYKLDARPDRLDLRDREYRPLLRPLPARYPSIKHIEPCYASYTGETDASNGGLVFDQGSEGACTGFGLAATINYLLWRQAIVVEERPADDPGSWPAPVSERMLYHLARLRDEWTRSASTLSSAQQWRFGGSARLPKLEA